MIEIPVDNSVHASHLQLGCGNVVRGHLSATVESQYLREVSVLVAREIERVLSQGFEGIECFFHLRVKVVVGDAADRTEQAAVHGRTVV